VIQDIQLNFTRIDFDRDFSIVVKMKLPRSSVIRRLICALFR
jgi:hypothetical protein